MNRGEEFIATSHSPRWHTAQLGHVARVGTGSADVQDATDDGRYPFFVRSEEVRSLNYFTHDTEAILTAGDGNVGDIFHHYSGKFAAHQRVYVIEPGNELVARFLYYAMRARFKESLRGNTAKSTVESLRRPMLTSFTIPVPPASDQHAIADYLDHETAEIDALIAELSDLGELLQERSSAIVDNTFLNHADHWAPLKRFGITKTSGYSANASVQPAGIGEVGVLKTGAVSQGSFNPLENKHVDDPTEAKKLRARVLAGNLIVNRANTPALVGKAAYVDRDYPDLFLSDLLWNLSFKGLDPQFVYFYSKSKKYREAIEVMSVGASSTMKKIRFEDFSRLEVPVLSVQRQKAVATKLRHSQDVLLETQQDIKRAIALARERRAALISAAVTGQIDVTKRHKPVAEVLEDEVRERV